MSDPETDKSDVGWASNFPDFAATAPQEISARLATFVGTPGESQVKAWLQGIPLLQREAREILAVEPGATDYSALLEHRLPLDSRRSDAILLVLGGVVVVELKGKLDPSSADLDQASAYARDLRAYHRECQDRPVHAILVPTRYRGTTRRLRDVWVCSPEHLDSLVRELTAGSPGGLVTRDEFLARDSYRPLPSLIQAARELFFSGSLKEVWRAKAATEPAVESIARIAHDAAGTRSRHLILVSGVPGSGKTLVGMRAVHAHYLDDLAVPRTSGKPVGPALFLSGNGPLVQVLQHVLRGAGGGGKTFVKHIKDYLDYYVPRAGRIPAEHLLVFDEAQRAFTSEKVATLHEWPTALIKSEPALFIELAERMPEWSVVVGLIGGGQEIYEGEEGGLGQWRDALAASPEPARWTVHAPAELEQVFAGSGVRTEWNPALHLDTELRYHTASRWHGLVNSLLTHSSDPMKVTEPIDSSYGLEGFRVWLTRDLEVAKQYLRDRYEGHSEARFGMLASSRDRLLPEYGVPNSWDETRRVKVGPWFADGEGSEHSCRQLTTCATEFQAQGLELDMALVAWGSDFIRRDGSWSSEGQRKYKRGAQIRDPHRLRTNAYRVLLTRGRDGNVVFVPPDRALDESWAFLRDAGFEELRD
jgi:DUF2075 family protein